MARFVHPMAAVLCLHCAIATAGLAQSVIRLGSEFQVNTYTQQNQRFPSVSLGDSGDFVVVWAGASGQDGNAHRVFGRRFSAAGVTLATEFQVSTSTSSHQYWPSVSLDAGGDFVVAWQSQLDGDDGSIHARRFTAAGVAQAVEFQVNIHTLGSQYYPSVALDADGDFVVVWNSEQQDGDHYGIFGRRFNSAGAAQAVEFQVNASTAGRQFRPAVAVDDQGDFVIAWQSVRPSCCGQAIVARAFSSAGVPVTGDLQVNTTYAAGAEKTPAVALDADGNFVVAWYGYGNNGVFARRFTSAGLTQGDDIQIAANGSGVSIDLEDDGDFVAAWAAYTDNQFDVVGQRFSADGSPQSAVFQVNAFTPQHQYGPQVSLDAEGDFVIAWQSDDQDGSSQGVFGQRFATLGILDIDGNGSADPLTDGLLALRYLFGFTGATLVTGAIGPGCTRCDAPAIEAYLLGLL